MDKVSIIIPVYKVENYLSRCLDSLINQTYENIEIIPVDDKSPDKSREIIKKYMAADQRIKPILRDINQGVSAARNAGIDAATGEWICFCDGDDWYEADYIEQMLRCAKSENADYIICDYQITADAKMPIASHTVESLSSGCDSRLVIACGPLSSCTHMISSRLFRETPIRYPLGCTQYEELCVMPAIAKFAEKIGVVNKPLYNYYQRGNGTSASNNPQNTRDNFLLAHKKLSELLGSDYECELEYHAIYALFYGEILALCKQKESTKIIVSKIKELEKLYPLYLKNPYLKNLGIAKRAFLICEKFRLIIFLRVFAKLHSKCVN